jgi:L-rhamnose-H+ transport protein
MGIDTPPPVNGDFVNEGTFLALPPCFPGVSLPPPADETRAHRLFHSASGRDIFAATRGPVPRLLQFRPKGTYGYAVDLGTPPGATEITALLSHAMPDGEMLHVACTGAEGAAIYRSRTACLVGIAISGAAGMSKEKELSQEDKAAAIKEFDFKKGMLVAVFAGVMSSCFAYGLAAGKPLGEITKVALETSGRSLLWQNLPVLVVVLWGGFTTNFIWCVILNIRNRSSHEYINMRPSHISDMSAAEGMMISAAPEITANREAAAHGASTGAASYEGPAPLLRNYLFCAVAGVTWYLQFFFYSMGETKMGAYTFSSWTLHMASIIIFSTIWGIFLHEWRGSSRKTMNLVFL